MNTANIMNSHPAPCAPQVLLGAGGQAAFVLNLLEWMGQPLESIVLFDDCFPKRQTGPQGRPIVGGLNDGVSHCLQNKIPAMVALGSRVAAVRYAVFRKLKDGGAHLTNVIHPSCVIAPTATLGCNVVMNPGCLVLPGATVESMCFLASNVTIEHDSHLGENVYCAAAVALAGFVKIGKHSFLGMGSVFADKITVGERVIIGAGAVVVSDFPDGVVAVGVPARVHRQARSGDHVPTLDDLKKLGV